MYETDSIDETEVMCMPVRIKPPARFHTTGHGRCSRRFQVDLGQKSNAANVLDFV